MMNLWKLPRTEEKAIRFLQLRGILPKERTCRNGHRMKLYISDRVYWKCTIRVCRQKVNMRVGNWFENSRIPFVKAVRFMYGWSHKRTSIKWCGHELEISNKTATDWNNYMREVAVASLNDGRPEKQKIGGTAVGVENAELLWRQKLHDRDPFDTILEEISVYWPPQIDL